MTTTLSPGCPTARLSAWFPCVEPPGEKRHQSALYHRAAELRQLRADLWTTDGVDAAVERDVARDDDPELLVELRRPALVPGRRERRGVRFAEGQVAVQERRRWPKAGGSVRASGGLVAELTS